MDINYNELTLEQLKEINKKSAAAIADFENRRKKDAIQKATEIAKAAGSLAGKAAASSPPGRAAAFVGQKAMQKGESYGEIAVAGSRNLAHRIAERSAKY